MPLAELMYTIKDIESGDIGWLSELKRCSEETPEKPNGLFCVPEEERELQKRRKAARQQWNLDKRSHISSLLMNTQIVKKKKKHCTFITDDEVVYGFCKIPFPSCLNIAEVFFL